MTTGTARDQPVLQSVLCVVEELHRDRQIADLARDGRYRHAGLVLDLGSDPDWLHGGSDDEEWRIEWVKMYEGLDLGAAFAATGDADYLRTWEQMVLTFCDQVPVDHDSTDVTARRVQNWIYAALRFTAAAAFDGFSDGFGPILADRIDADVSHIAGHLTPQRNHRTLELYTLLLAGLARGNGANATSSLILLTANAVEDVWADGVHRECSSDYHCIVLRSLVGAVQLARAADMEVPTLLLDRVDAAATVAMHLQRPDGIMPAFSDGDEGDYRSLLARTADVLHREDLRWVASMGREGTPPATLGATFNIGGYLTQRSGWGDGLLPYAKEWWAVLDCGPIGDGGHGHYDQLHVDLFAGGRPLAVDPGRFTYADGPDGWRHWFKGTAAHNTVTVDGLDQIPYRRGKPRGERATARLVSRHTGPLVDRITAESRSPTHDAVHTRTLTLRRGRGWSIRDDLMAPTPHAYVLRWHLPPEASGVVTLQRGSHGTDVGVPGARFAISGPGIHVSIEEGWVSRSYGLKEPAPVIRADIGPCREATILTHVTPC